ncbi:hypothetical protein E4U43_006803 [Claviceps pusilla]|uniref:Uncharacterized protein n=1 Tax=Claviceps pusilla TaxID=123648 RepID=A0A9P7SUR6_9HYPO|nr:hypothetical protein E4U43_006803 [Claviceps pusilla]
MSEAPANAHPQESSFVSIQKAASVAADGPASHGPDHAARTSKTGVGTDTSRAVGLISASTGTGTGTGSAVWSRGGKTHTVHTPGVDGAELLPRATSSSNTTPHAAVQSSEAT